LIFNHFRSNTLSEQSSIDSDGPSTLICSKPTLGILRKSWKNRKKTKSAKLDSPTKENNVKPAPSEEEASSQSNDWSKNLGFDFVAEDFEGTTVLRTTCLECEIVTERKQTMCDISVPIPEEGRVEGDRVREPSAVYQNACVTSEYLRDQNKYWCDECVRYNEARRSVTYETLPRLLVLQLKRFSGGMKKLTSHMPTPLNLACFCDTCCTTLATERPHRYILYGVIMHLGQTLTGGHYISYIRAHCAGTSMPYLCCDRDNKSCLVSNSSEKPNFMKNLFARNKNNGAAEKIQPVKRKVVTNSVQSNTTLPTNGSSFCSSMECCGVKLNKNIWNSDEQGPSDRDVWLMCDDETVKTITTEEFDELLSSKPKIRSTSTPYLLFYVRSDSE
jgi:ubiquitin carboxyl-terminal hydrolase 1